MARDPWEELAEELVHGSEEEYVTALTERMMQLLVDGCENPDEFAAIASRSREVALGVWAERSREVTAETEAAFMEALSAEQEVLEATLAEAFGEVPGLTARGQNEVNQAARGMSEILGRQNVALADNLADEWWRATSDAVTRIQLGEALQDVVRDGARRLAAAGLETIDYKSGVRTTIDAAVRRHAITQQNQCRNDMLARDCRAYGVELVFTSAHYGARPTHAEWQGKPYGLDGPCEVDGVKYRGLAEATGYGTVAGLAGANCRHRIHPYVPGITKLPDTDFAAFEARYHMSSDEYYEATQRQRAIERQIRATKRGIALGEAHGADMTEDRYRLGAQQKRLREHCRRTGLPRDYAREQAYAAADKDGTGISIFHQPTALSAVRRPRPSGGIAVGIDELVPCLRRNSDGKILATTVRELGSKELKGYNPSNGWMVNWQRLAKTENTHVFCINVEGSDEIQGLVAIQRPTEPGAYPYGLWAVANPKSQGSRVGGENKEYNGIGGHLFAIMCEQSLEWGFEGIVTGMAADAKLLGYYESEFGAESAGGLKFFIGPEQAKALIETYNYERK